MHESRVTQGTTGEASNLSAVATILRGNPKAKLGLGKKGIIVEAGTVEGQKALPKASLKNVLSKITSHLKNSAEVQNAKLEDLLILKDFTRNALKHKEHKVTIFQKSHNASFSLLSPIKSLVNKILNRTQQSSLEEIKDQSRIVNELVDNAIKKRMLGKKELPHVKKKNLSPQEIKEQSEAIQFQLDLVSTLKDNIQSNKTDILMWELQTAGMIQASILKEMLRVCNPQALSTSTMNLSKLINEKPTGAIILYEHIPGIMKEQKELKINLIQQILIKVYETAKLSKEDIEKLPEEQKILMKEFNVYFKKLVDLPPQNNDNIIFSSAMEKFIKEHLKVQNEEDLEEKIQTLNTEWRENIKIWREKFLNLKK